MLSRRNVRIKVMQLLYALNRDEEVGFDDAVKAYWKSIDQSYELFLFNIYTILQITRIAIEDEDKRKSKYIPNEVDSAFTPKLFHNPLMQDLNNNGEIQKVFDKFHFDTKVDKDIFRNIYYDFAKEEPYNQFILNTESTEEDTLEILLELFRFCRRNDSYNEIIEDHYVTWDDDKSLVIGSIKKVLKALPSTSKDFYKEYYPDDETVKEFGEKLLVNTYKNDEQMLHTIRPILMNWDPDRVAVIDMILIKMGITEFLNSPTIPAKVTLNEYVELSKIYSTSKSKDFINGVLDRILNVLKAEGKYQKEGRGLLE